MEKKNHVAILAFFFIIALILIPSIFIYWYSETVKYDLDGNRIGNKQRFYELLNENSLIKNFPECLSLAEEFIDRPVKSIEESKELKKLEI